MARPKKRPPNRSDGRYEYKETIGKRLNGTAIRKSFYSTVSLEDAKRQAKEYVAELEVQRRTGELLVDKSANFKDWAEQWLAIYKKGKVKNNTYTGTYEIPTVKHLIPYFGKADLRDIKPADVQAFFNSKTESSLESKKKMRVCLRSIFDTAIENDLCYKNPVTRSITLHSTKQPPEKRTYTKEQRDAVLAYAKTHPNGLDVWVMLETGVSRSELLGIRWENINEELRALQIRQGLVKVRDPDTGENSIVVEGLKTHHRRRDIPISNELLAALLSKPRVIYTGGNVKQGRLPTEKHPEQVFHSPEGGPYDPDNWGKRCYEKFMKDMHAAHPDIPILNAHELRHTAATLWKDQGVDLFSIAKILGHGDLDMLAKRYAHNNLDVVRAAMGFSDDNLTTIE